MEYQSLGRTGVPVSTLCLGCMNFGWKTEEADAFAIIDKALDEGINFLDTANVYGRGASETIVGKKDSAPKRASTGWLCIERTSPIINPVTERIGIDLTPSSIMCLDISANSYGGTKTFLKKRSEKVDNSATVAKNNSSLSF